MECYTPLVVSSSKSERFLPALYKDYASAETFLASTSTSACRNVR